MAIDYAENELTLRIDAAVRAEREACAKLAEAKAQYSENAWKRVPTMTALSNIHTWIKDKTAYDIATLIRARSKPSP